MIVTVHVYKRSRYNAKFSGVLYGRKKTVRRGVEEERVGGVRGLRVGGGMGAFCSHNGAENKAFFRDIRNPLFQSPSVSFPTIKYRAKSETKE